MNRDSWSLAEARHAWPEVRQELRIWQNELGELRRMQSQPMPLGSRDRSDFLVRMGALRDALRRYARRGIIVQNLAEGVIDFLSEAGEQRACLCVTLDEDQILHWHSEGSGFAARQPIPEPVIDSAAL